MIKTLHWGILGSGNIANKFAHGLASSHSGRLVAVASRDRGRASAFAASHGASRAYGTYDELLQDPDVQAVYISILHPWHAEWARKAAAAGKHILCEKPIAMNASDAASVIEAARKANVFLMEAFMYRCHPQTARLVELIQSGAIGEVKMIQAAFGFRIPFDPDSRLLNPQLGGGGILDVGCYPVSISRLIAGVATGKPFADPVDLSAQGNLGPVSQVDEQATAILKFPCGILAQVSCSVQVEQDNAVRIYGTRGSIHLDSPWKPAPDGGLWSFNVFTPDSSEPEIICGEESVSLYGLEADYVAARLEERQAASPGMSWNDTLGNMRTLDRWRNAIGLRYPGETVSEDEGRQLTSSI